MVQPSPPQLLPPNCCSPAYPLRPPCHLSPFLLQHLTAICAALLAVLQEAGIMAMLRHPNCTQYLGVVLDPPCLLMEYCSRRSVDAILAAAHTDPKV